MAVVQISRIQVRRGKAKEGTGVPQLASGEIAWAVDTQQLYIGNGSVAEGAPAVGNTKILTENDLNGQGNILDLIHYIYDNVDGSIIQTGPSAAITIERTLQDRLDDRVNSKDFGTVSDAVADDTTALQRAIDQLFLNPAIKASHSDLNEYTTGTPDAVEQRVILELPAGIFKITSTLYIPSYATIVGAGKEKTIIEYSGTGPAIQFVNDTSSVGEPDVLDNSLYTTQPRFITLSNLTVYTKTATQTALQLDAVRDSIFKNISIKGNWAGTFAEQSIGLALNAKTDMITCERNSFSNIDIVGFQVGVYAPYDISKNTFNNMFINNVFDGIVLGAKFLNSTEQLFEVSGNQSGEEFGPRDTVITNSVFGDLSVGIKRHALFVGRGNNNSIVDSKLINVGNDGSGVENPVYPQIYFNSFNNTIENTASDRTKELTNPSSNKQYVPEIAGIANYSSFGTAYALLSGGSGTPLPAFRLPLPTDKSGMVLGKNSFKIDYTFKLDSGDTFVRQGTLYVTADANNVVTQLADEYNFAGNGLNELILDFRSVIVDAFNNQTNDAESAAAILIEYLNVPFSGIVYYSYTATTHDSSIVPTF